MWKKGPYFKKTFGRKQVATLNSGLNIQPLPIITFLMDKNSVI